MVREWTVDVKESRGCLVGLAFQNDVLMKYRHLTPPANHLPDLCSRGRVELDCFRLGNIWLVLWKFRHILTP